MKKTILLTETQLDNLKKIGIISEAIREELSIHADISKETNRILLLIDSMIKGTEKTKFTDGVYKQTISIPSFNLCGYDISIGVTNYDFRDSKTFDRLFPSMENELNISGVSPLIDRKKFFVILRTCSISGGLRKDISGDNLQHELEHCFQMSLSGSELPRGKNYTKALSILPRQGSENSLDYILSYILYLSYPFEQDGFVNGLYQYVFNMEKEPPVHRIEDIIETPACKYFFKMKEYIEKIKKMKKADVEDEIKVLFGMSYNKFMKLAEIGLERFRKKIGNVLALHWKEITDKKMLISEIRWNKSCFSII